ncbi:MAG: sugar ABC transporter permease [Christensenellales bacterium]|jgi:D-xylose transport system permease protein
MEKNSISKPKINFNVRTYTMIAALFILWIIFSFTTDWAFITARNLSNLMRQMSIVGIMSIGMVMVIVTGGIDLSAGSVMGFISCIAAALQVWSAWGTAETIIVVLLAGALIGLINGVLIAYTGVPAFIITLGGQLIFRGAVLAVTRGTTVAPLEKSFLEIGQAFIDPTLGYILAALAVVGLLIKEYANIRAKRKYELEVSVPMAIIRWIVYSVVVIAVIILVNSYRGLPSPVLLMLILVIIFTFITEKTTFGRKVYALGGNMDAAKYSGINVRRNVTVVYLLNGFLNAIAGIVLAARLNAGTPQAGMNLELDAIASAVIGGTSMTGGIGKPAGAILGALIMATIDNGMSMMNLDAFWQYIVKGIILVVAVWFDVRTRARGTKT